jgi:hypothetical protein
LEDVVEQHTFLWAPIRCRLKKNVGERAQQFVTLVGQPLPRQNLQLRERDYHACDLKPQRAKYGSKSPQLH